MARMVMNAEEIRRALIRISHEIVEKEGTEGLVVVGIQRRGVPLAKVIVEAIKEHEGVDVEYGTLDISFYRDDLSTISVAPVHRGTSIPGDITDKTVILVDDVLYTGRTIRAGLDALIDRGHRELPIRADHVGKNIPTTSDEVVRVCVKEFDGDDLVKVELLAEHLAANEAAAKAKG
jgi:pyrimidine operon attenuation protein/uracil phosphoribosyltransferase